MPKRASKRKLKHAERHASNVVSLKSYRDQVQGHRPKLEAKTEGQANYLMHMRSKALTFGIGLAGCGKTYMAASLAAQQLADKRVGRLIVTRPVVEAKGRGGGLGFLPGTQAEKVDPYFEPFRQVLTEYFGASHLALLLKRKTIEFVPMELMRGLSFDNSFIILDESQNTTPGQMKLFLTRIGEYSTVVVNGDTDQKDIPGLSGLEDASRRLEGLDQVGITRFTEDDVVRSGLTKDILIRYRTS